MECVKFVSVRLPAKDSDDFPSNFPLIHFVYDCWDATIDSTTGRILDWPDNFGARLLSYHVGDQGSYHLLDKNMNTIASIEHDYVPESIPGKYGDYVNFIINEDGFITNWPKDPNFEHFFQEEE